tara:strand:+ start:221 stop:685 length:465 start_codon:yes stop_codon:yes gene_type:complete
MKHIFLIFIILFSSFSYSQEDIIAQAQQNAISSMSLVDALASRVPGAKKITDRMGNKNIAIRGRQSFKTAGNQVLWEIDGVIYNNPPVLNANQVKYVEVLSGLAATNKYGSEGAGGVIVVKTNVSTEKFNSRRNLWNRSSKVPKKKKDKKVKKS